MWRRERDSTPRTHYTTTPLAEEPLIATWVSLQDNGSPSRTRTCDNSINSRVLYQLSYQGIFTLVKQMNPAWQRPTLPGPCGPSTIGAGGLNGRVRDGYAWNPSAVATKPAFQRKNNRSFKTELERKKRSCHSA